MKMSSASATERVVQVRFQPMWRYIDGIREFCGFFTRTTFDDPEVGDRIGVVVHELVENAIRYSSRNESSLLHLAVYSRDEEIEVVVANSAEESRVKEFEKIFEKINQGDALDAYSWAMQRARGLPEDQSGLGLPRIRYEGRMSLSMTVDNNVVSVRAKGKL
jgi:hypothetical protein